MKIPDEVRKTVGFVMYLNQVTGDMVPVGSSFFAGHDPKDGQFVSPKVYAVTARHVIDGLKRRGVLHTFLRLNSKTEANPFVTIMVPIERWWTHQNDMSLDVAVVEMGIPAEADHVAIPFRLAATKQIFVDHEVERGDEVFVSGLFTHHYGRRRNIPIVRVGNLAALNEERIVTKSYGEMEAYLVEARSIGGLSGSPVFLNLGAVRQIRGEVKHAAGKDPVVFLLGLIHGHFDVKVDAVDAGMPVDDATDEKVNAGIAIVVPIESIMSVIEAYEKQALSR